MRHARSILVALALVVLPAAIYAAATHAGASSADAAGHSLVAPERLAPDSVRITVEVLNASTVQGLARRATFHLRDRGFDVVESGNAREKHDSTLVLDRSGHPEWARLLARAMGGATVVELPDSAHYVDATVLIGPSWRPPSEPFYP